MADVEDIGSRRILGFAMAEHMRTELVASAMDMAIAVRGGDVEGMIFHHDRGAQYMSREFRELCERHGIEQSTGRTGSSLDNAVAESLWASLKRELVSRCRFASRAEARRAIIAWINHYNAVRLHSSLGGVPPIEWELAPLPLDDSRRGRRPRETVLSDRSCGSQMHRPGTNHRSRSQPSARTITPTSTCPALLPLGGDTRWRDRRGQSWYVEACRSRAAEGHQRGVGGVLRGAALRIHYGLGDALPSTISASASGPTAVHV